MVPQSQRREQLFTLTQGPCLCEPRRTITPGERTPPGGSPASGKAVALTLRAPCLSAPSEPLSQAPLPDPGDHRRSPVSAVGAAPSSLGVSSRRRSRTLAPRFRFRSALGTTPPGAELLSPGPQPLPPRAPQPLRPVLTPHPVHVGRHGRSRRLLRPHKGDLEARGGAELSSRRSPERGAGASRKSRSGPRSRHLRRLSRRGSSRPALSPRLLPPHARGAEAGAGLLGSFRNEFSSRRRGARLGSPPPSQRPSRRWALSAAETAGPARLGVRLLPEHLRPIRRTRPGARLRSERETPRIGHFRKRFGSLRPTAAPRSVISAAARPRLRRREELGFINSLVAGALPLRLPPGEKRACALHRVICKRLCLSFA